MKPKGIFCLLLIAVVALAAMFRTGWAQTAPPTDTVPPITNGLAHENAGPGGLGARSPGNMVAAGVAASQSAVILGRTNSATITQTEDESDAVDDFFESAVDLIIEQIEDLVIYFLNLLLERIGLPPLVPDNGNTNTNSNTNSNTNTNTNSNTNSNDNTNGNTNDNTNGNTNDNNNANANANTNTNTNTNTNDNTRPGGVRKSLRR